MESMRGVNIVWGGIAGGFSTLSGTLPAKRVWCVDETLRPPRHRDTIRLGLREMLHVFDGVMLSALVSTCSAWYFRDGRGGGGEEGFNQTCRRYLFSFQFEGWILPAP